MIASDYFSAIREFPLMALDAIAGGGLVVVAPHPDDESLGCGGILAKARDLGIAVRLVVLSDGAGSHPNSQNYPPARLRALREEETCHAMAALGYSRDVIRFIGLPDASVPTSGPQATTAQDAILAAVREIAAEAVLVTWSGDPHCDHVAAAKLVDGLQDKIGNARVFAYPVWGWTLPPEHEVGAAPRGCRIDIAKYLPAKAKAIAAHRSQTTNLIDDDPDGFRLAPETLAHFQGPFEFLIFVERQAHDSF